MLKNFFISTGSWTFWVEKTSLHNILEWFDAVETVKGKSSNNAVEWTTSTSKRDQLFLEILGMGDKDEEEEKEKEKENS